MPWTIRLAYRQSKDLPPKKYQNSNLYYFALDNATKIYLCTTNIHKSTLPISTLVHKVNALKKLFFVEQPLIVFCVGGTCTEVLKLLENIPICLGNSPLSIARTVLAIFRVLDALEYYMILGWFLFHLVYG